MSAMLTVGQASELLGVTPKTLRHLERSGLVCPKRSRNGYRLFSAADLLRVQRVRYLQSLGFSLKRIKTLLRKGSSAPLWEEVLKSLLQETATQIDLLEKRRARILSILSEEQVRAPDQTAELPPTLKLAQERLGERLVDVSPALWEKERELYSVLDGLELPGSYHEQMNALLTYFQEHPDVHREMVRLAERIVKLKEEPNDSEQPEQVAQAYAEFLRAHPELQQLLYHATGLSAPLEKMLGELLSETAALSPGQQAFLQAAQEHMRRKADSW